jgi:LysR family transcriptional regulator, regulator for bpeEF and oprC
MDRIRALEVFVRVVELGSFTKAADSLRVPKASVTHWVRELEEHLGVRLLQRTTRRLSLTDDGTAYLEGARRVLSDLAELDAGVRQARVNPRGRVRVDVPAAAGRHVLAPALPGFLAQYPDIQVEIGSSDRPVDLVLEGVDCVVRGGPVFDETLVARPLGAFEVVTCAAPSYLVQAGTPRTPDDLAEHRFVNFFSAKTGRVFPFEFQRDGQTLSVPGKHQVAANDADTHVALGVAGLGLLQVPRTRHVNSLIEAGALVPVLAKWHAGRLPLSILYPRNRHLSGRVRAFVDWTVALYQKKFAEMPRA